MTKRMCPWCGDELERAENEPEWNWNNRKYCNKNHAAKHSAEKRKGSRK